MPPYTAAVIAQQETLLSERQSALEKSAREQTELVREADAARSEVRTLTSRVEDQRAKLEAGRCRLTVPKPVLKAPVISALETGIS
jgi:hypothetical protein